MWGHSILFVVVVCKSLLKQVGEMKKTKTSEFLETPLRVINIGLEGFAHELQEQGVPVIHVDWSPPAGGDPKLAELLLKLGT